MAVAGTTPHRRHGLAGLLVALFVVAGLAYSYGLGHAPVIRICTAHSTAVPAGVVAAIAQQPPGAADAAGAASPAVKAAGQAAPADSMSSPVKPPPLRQGEACLSLAVLLTLMVLTLAAAPRRSRFSRPPRSDWSLSPPVRSAAPSSVSLASLQVLRL